MAWGTGSPAKLVAKADRITRVNQAGVWFHWHDLTYSFEVRALSESSATSYTPSAAYGGEVSTPKGQEIDPSGQWMVTWDEVVRDPAIDADPNVHTGYSD